MGASVKVYDPEAMKNAKQELGDDSITYCSNKYAVMKGADALCILTEWAEFANLDLKKVKKLLKKKVIFDGRNLLDRDEFQKEGFDYFAIGKVTNGLIKQQKEGGRPSYAILSNGEPKK